MASKGAKAEKGTRRKLVAVLCADVVGYSRLMGADEEASIETLPACRKGFVSQINIHRGRVIDLRDDAFRSDILSTRERRT